VDITGRMLEMLAGYGYARGDKRIEKAIKFILSEQEPDGSWFGRWGVNYIYGTFLVLRGLDAIGFDHNEPQVQQAAEWIRMVQNSDGGWGEDARSYDDPSWVGRGPSTASQTAWALLALHAAGERWQGLARGVEWLVSTQREDGGWDEPQYTGTGFPSDYYINYHLYRLIFPIMALGRCLEVAPADASATQPG